MNNLAQGVINQAESLESIAQLLHAAVDQGETNIVAAAKACQRDLELYACSLRIVAAQINHPSMKLGSVLMAPLLRSRLDSRMGKGANETDIGELLEDYVSCGLELQLSSLRCLHSIDLNSRCLIQASIWMDAAYEEFDPLFESVVAHWNAIESQKVAA